MGKTHTINNDSDPDIPEIQLRRRPRGADWRNGTEWSNGALKFDLNLVLKPKNINITDLI